MRSAFKIGSRCRILAVCGRLLNRGTIVDATDNSWIVRPDGCRLARFARKTGILQPNPRRDKWPRIVL
jgi:hypothetical protein